MAKMFRAGWPGLFLVVSAQFTLKLCVAARSRLKLNKTSYFSKYSYFTPPFKKHSFSKRKILSQKNYTLYANYMVKPGVFISLGCDRQTDEPTDGQNYDS